MVFPVDEFPRGEVIDYPNWRGPQCSGMTLICSGSGMFSAMIQKATGSVWSHIGKLHWDTESGRLGVIESVEGHGFRMVALSHYLKDYNASGKPYPGGLCVIKHRYMNADRAQYGYQWAWPLLGHPYDKQEIISIAQRIMFGYAGDRDTDTAYICSEAGAYYDEAAGCPVQWNTGGFIAPSDYALDPNYEMVGVLQPKPTS